jgi:hypothetical protein
MLFSFFSKLETHGQNIGSILPRITNLVSDLFYKVDAKAADLSFCKITIQVGFRAIQGIERDSAVPQPDTKQPFGVHGAFHVHNAWSLGICVEDDICEQLLQNQPNILNTVGREYKSLNPAEHKIFEDFE